LLAGKAEQAQAPLSGISVFYWSVLCCFVLKTAAILILAPQAPQLSILAIWRQNEFGAK